MKYLLERDIKLKKSEFENLYDWALQEYDKNGEEIGSPKIPAELSFSFTSTKISYYSRSSKESFELEDDKEASFSERESIKVELKPGSIRENDKGLPYIFDDLSYSFFGTRRSIDNFHMSIVKLNSEQDKDMALAYGIPSYTFDYDKKTTEDCLEINLFLNENRFSSLTKSIQNKTISHIEFNAEFFGFYYEWSPSEFYGQFLNEIKVLSEDEDGHMVSIPEDLDITPTRLGELHNFSLTEVSPIIKNNSFLKIRKEDGIPDELPDELPEDEDINPMVSEESRSELKMSKLQNDFYIRDTLKKIQKPLWLIALLLFFILIQMK